MQADILRPTCFLENVIYNGNMPQQLSRQRPKQGARLMELRKTAHLTQTELAELVGETQTNIAYWEQSDKPPRSDVIPKLAEVLGVHVTAFLAMDRPPLRRNGPVGKVQRVFEDVSKLPRRYQTRIIETVSALVKDYKRSAS